MLTHFENFNFSALQFHIADCHFLFAHNFNSDLLASFLVYGSFDQSKFAFAKSLLDIIKIKQISIANSLTNSGYPLLFIFNAQQVVQALTSVRENQSKWMQLGSGIKLFHGLFFDENAN